MQTRPQCRRDLGETDRNGSVLQTQRKECDKGRGMIEGSLRSLQYLEDYPWVFVFMQLLKNQSSKMRLEMTVIYYHVPAVGKGVDIKSLFLVHFGCLVQFDCDTRDRWHSGSLSG